ncbi:hypothetical protein [Comamonas suwonensis]|uniref:hypothetical protein n=1 Tax=Comamonas suwonensis TaxID=2606214 RepID=UPI00145FC9D7|nr:hypothetical protein [Comamonas suwonensis]MBI1624741.1 hypothetical protein [Comamonas suwonensis]
MLNAPDRAFLVYIVNKTKDQKLNKLVSKMSDHRTFSLPFQKEKYEKIGAARREFESRILQKMELDPGFTRDFIEKVGEMSVMTSEHANLGAIVNGLHAAAISQLSASAAQSVINDILGEL